jgi:hypothetical protein
VRKVDYMFGTNNHNINIACASTIMGGALPSVHVTCDKCIVPFMFFTNELSRTTTDTLS